MLYVVCYHVTSHTSLITRSDIPPSRITISLAAILCPLFCTRALRHPLLFRVSDPFAKQCMLTTYELLKSCNDLKALRGYYGTVPDNPKLDTACAKTAITTDQGKVSLNIILGMPTWPSCFRQPCPTKTSLALW